MLNDVTVSLMLEREVVKCGKELDAEFLLAPANMVYKFFIVDMTVIQEFIKTFCL